MPIDVTISKATYRAGSQFYDVDDSHIPPETNPPVVTASGYTGALTPSDNGAGGTFTLVPTFTDRWSYVPLNRTQDISIKVTDSVPAFDTVALSVKATWPIQPNFGYELDTPFLSQVKTMKDGTPKFRRINTRHAVWQYTFLNRIIADVSVVKAFEQWHNIDKEFYLLDYELTQQVLCRLDSSVKVKPVESNKFEMAVIVKAYKISTFVVPTTYSGLIPA